MTNHTPALNAVLSENGDSSDPYETNHSSSLFTAAMLPSCVIHTRLFHSFEGILMTPTSVFASVCTWSLSDSVRHSRGGANCTGISRIDVKLSGKPLQHADGAL